MELRDFVKDVIISIREGIKNAEESVGSMIVPREFDRITSIAYADKRIKQKDGSFLDEQTVLSNVEFEVSLVEGSKDGTTSGLGVFLGSIGVGAKGSSEDLKSSMTRIKFTDSEAIMFTSICV